MVAQVLADELLILTFYWPNQDIEPRDNVAKVHVCKPCRLVYVRYNC